MKKNLASLLILVFVCVLLFGCATPAKQSTVHSFPVVTEGAVLHAAAHHTNAGLTVEFIELTGDDKNVYSTSVGDGDGLTAYYHLTELDIFVAVSPENISSDRLHEDSDDIPFAAQWPELTFYLGSQADGIAFLTVTNGERAYDIRHYDDVEFESNHITHKAVTSGTVPATASPETWVDILTALDLSSFFEN